MFDINWKNFLGKDYKYNSDKIKIEKTVSKDNYKHNNFEQLAKIIAEDKTGKQWKHTPWSRDNNHDAFVIMTLFDEWWLEAKYSYSEKTQSLSRYRLDATIVSKMLAESKEDYNNKRISKIFIFTNAHISVKVKSDITNALKYGRSDCSVEFMQKEDIEYWLFCHPKTYKKFFNSTLPFSNSNCDFYIDSSIEVFPVYYKYLNFRFGQTNRLNKNSIFIILLSIFTQNKLNLDIRTSKGIEILEYPKSISETQYIEIKAKIVDYFKNPVIYINNKQIPLEGIEYTEDIWLKIASHDNIYNEANKFLTSNCDMPCSIFMVFGKNATGKSTILKSLINDSKFRYFYISFDYNTLYNIKNIVYFIYHLFFPYVYWEDIDKDYLMEIAKAKGTGFETLYQLSDILEDMKVDIDIETLKIKLNKIKLLFPKDLNNGTVVLFIDNLQRMDAIESEFFEHVLDELSISSFKVKIVAFGNTYFKDNYLYQKLNSYKIPNNINANGEMNCDITSQDIINNLNMLFNTNLNLSLTDVLFTNIFEIVNFIKYLGKNKILLDSNNAFLLEFSRYKNQNESIIEIKNYFERCINSFTLKTKALLDNIYYSTGFPIINRIDSEEYHAQNQLLSCNLIKTDFTNNMLEPFHETYRNIYFKFFPKSIKEAENSFEFIKTTENLILRLNFNSNHEDRIDAAKRICSLTHRSPSTVMYALDPIFSRVNENKSSLINEFGPELFYKMYLSYATVCGYNSTNTSSYAVCTQICEDLSNYSEYNMRELLLVTLYQRLNSEFDGIRIKQAKESYKTFVKEYNSLTSVVEETKDLRLRFLLAEEIKTFIMCTENHPYAEEEFLALRKLYLKAPMHSFYHYMDYTSRFSQLLYVIDINKAYKYTEQAFRLLNSEKVHKDDKQNKTINFQIEYIKMIRDDNPKQLKTLKDLCDKFKNGFMVHQRKVQCALTAAFLKYGDVKSAEDYIQQEIQIISPRRLKLEVFYKQNLALYELVAKKDTDSAIQLLKEASESAKDVYSYKKVIEHNLNLLTATKSVPNKIEFLTSDKMKPDTYYIDPRADR